MFELFRLLFGYVRFCAYGGFAERFVNLCDLQKIKVRSLSFNEERLEGFVTARDYKKLRPVAKRSGMRLSCLSKHGLPFFLFKNRNRVGLAIGAAFFAVFMCIMSLFLWSVDTVGSERLSREEILSVAKSFGLREGAFIPKIDVHELSDSMITEMNGKLLWAAVNISGCRAVIEVRDYIQKPESKTYGEPCNIVADFDGLLLSLQVYNGTKANREGNGVKKGDLLISGIVENRDLSSVFREARGKITAYHEDSLSFFSPAQEKQRVYLKEDSVNYLRIFSLKIPLGFFKKGGLFEEHESEKQLCLRGVPLPFTLVKCTRLYYKEEEKAPDCVLERALDGYTSKAFEEYGNTLVLNTEISLSKTQKGVLISSENECIDFIGEKQKLLFETG